MRSYLSRLRKSTNPSGVTKSFKKTFLNPRGILFILLFLFCIYSTIIYLTVGQQGGDSVLVVLSSQFTKWNIDLPTNGLPVRDISNYYNNYYVYFGPLSSILLIPFVLVFGVSFPQVSIGIFSVIVSFWAVYKITQSFKFSVIDSLWLALFFVFSTVLFASSIVDITAWQVESLGVPFILLSLCCYFAHKNPLLIGLFLGMAVLSRFTLMLSVSFFFFEVLFKRFTGKQFVLLLLPVIIALGILGVYNLRRFHSILETGYNYNISKNDTPIAWNKVYGDISLHHLPSNLYSFLVMAPLPTFQKHSRGFNVAFPYMRADAWGVAIWFTSPLFLFLLTSFKKGKYMWSAIVAALLLSVPVFFWYSIGFAQFGYRYALDFLPFLFLLLLPSLSPKLTRPAIFLIIVGILFNALYSDSIFATYPLLHLTIR